MLTRQITTVGWAIACVVTLRWVSACDASTTGTGDSGVYSSAGGSGPVTHGCGDTCSCEDTAAGITLTGTWDCNANQCSCQACVGFVPDTAPTFDSCGGEPFGTWKAVAVDPAGAKMFTFAWTDLHQFNFGFNCPAQVADVSSPLQAKFLLKLVSGGAASIYADGGVIAKLNVQRGCLQYDERHIPAACVAQTDCVSQCPLKVFPWFNDVKFWTRSGGTLSLTWDDSAIYSNSNAMRTQDFPYCVTGNTMQLYDPLTKVTFTMQRVNETGTPQACKLRNSETCQLGGGCVQGGCQGSSSCSSASTELSCTNRAGCSWDPNLCSGTADTTCSWMYYDVVPGCVFTTATSTK